MGAGIGFTLGLTVLGAVRELLGSGAFFGWKILQGDAMLYSFWHPCLYSAGLSYGPVQQDKKGIILWNTSDHYIGRICQQYCTEPVSGRLPVPGCVQ
jgi:hypothetical protein